MGWRFNDVKATGCYELARYWCLIEKLADGRTATLVNLGLPALFTGVQGDRLDRFVAALDTSEQRRFQKVTWTELLAPILPKAEDWFVQFCRDDRKLLSP